MTKATMRIQHKPGDAVQVDWAIDTFSVYDPVTGEQSSAYLFVAVLPCSSYTYAEACEDMKTENWLSCHVHAFRYFGGVTQPLILDNCKTATTANTRYETVLNKYLAYNAGDFSCWAMSIGSMTEKVGQHFLTSGTALRQGYKACASLTKLGERYGRERLENASGRILAYSVAPSIHNIGSLLKNGQDRPAKAAPQDKLGNSNRFGITRGASYFRKGGEG